MYKSLEEKLGLKFKTMPLYERAFTHKSFVHEHPDGPDMINDNERLEFLGDAVLELATTEHLFAIYPQEDEGTLTAWRSALVEGKHLAEVGRKLELGQYLRLSKGEENSGGRNKDYILANTVEALIGAVHIDLGYNAAVKMIEEFIIDRLEALIAAGADKDPKSTLQEISQDNFGVTPHYDCLEEAGPDHDKTFTMAAYIGKRRVGTGSGSSKQKATQAAAAAALDSLAKEEVKGGHTNQNTVDHTHE